MNEQNESSIRSEAIEWVMHFYDTTREIVEELYMDEVEAYIRLHQKGVFNNE